MAGTVFVIDGRSATGKSAIQRHVLESHPHIVSVRKFTTRPHRDRIAAGTDADQILVSAEEFDTLGREEDFLSYSFACYRYGLRLRDVLHAGITRGQDVLVIIRHVGAIMQLKEWAVTVGLVVVVILLQATEAARRRYLRRLGYSEDRMKKRLSRDDGIYDQAREQMPLYDAHLDNNGALEDLFAGFMAIVKKCRAQKATSLRP